MKLKEALIIFFVILFFSFIIVFVIGINKRKIAEKHYKPAVKMQGVITKNEENYIEENETEKSVKNDITIYDLEEGYLTVPFNNKANKNIFNWDKLDNSNISHYKYEDDKYYSKLGIDVSSYQGDIDWERVKNAGVEFAILRLGYRGYGEKGTVLLDDKFEQNYENAKNNGIEVGVYFFSQSINLEEVRYEAQFVLENIKGKEISYPIVFDLEKIKYDTARTDNLTSDEINEMTKEFCKTIKENGYTPCIYGNSKTFTTRLKLEDFNGIKKWYADYLDKPLYLYEFNIWQYTESGNIDGIEGNVDINIEFVKK